MGMIQAITRGIQKLSSYDAGNWSTRRRNVSVKLGREDDILNSRRRERLMSNTRHYRRNSTAVAWMVRKHLDYVSTFNCQITTGDPALDRRLEDWVDGWARDKDRCDARGRHDLHTLCRLWEECRTIDGDVFVVRFSNGTIQVVESDRVRTPTDWTDYESYKDTEGYEWVEGVQLDSNGRPVNYAICDRATGPTAVGGYQVKYIIPARFVHHIGYFDRIDQVRGISPLAPAIAAFADLYEMQEYSLAKAKFSALMMLKITRDKDAEMPVEENEDGTVDAGYEIDLTTGNSIIDMLPGDNAAILESSNPSDQYQNFTKLVLASALKGLDIPYSTYDESFTNYSGNRGAYLGYERSCRSKRRPNAATLEDLTRWILEIDITDGRLVVPDDFDLALARIKWIGPGLEWIDPLKEAKADISLIEAKLDSRQGVCLRHGRDWHDIVGELEDEERIIAEKSAAPAGQPDLAALLNAYGVAVRSGAISPQVQDEDHLRKVLSLPSLEKSLRDDWGVRRPVTINIEEDDNA